MPERDPMPRAFPAVTGPASRAARRRWAGRALAFGLGLGVLAGCAATPVENRRCIDMVGSGQHSHRMVEMPCTDKYGPEADGAGN